MNTKCPYCDYDADRHTLVEGESNPANGDISFCVNCGEVSEFWNGKLDKIDMDNISDNLKKEIIKIKIAWRKTKDGMD